MATLSACITVCVMFGFLLVTCFLPTVYFLKCDQIAHRCESLIMCMCAWSCSVILCRVYSHLTSSVPVILSMMILLRIKRNGKTITKLQI